MNFRYLRYFLPLLYLLLLSPALSMAADMEYHLVIKNHRFEPAEFIVPAAKKIKLIVDNQDATPEEFESRALNREKIIAGMSKATIYIGPLASGKYPFVGEFHEAMARGTITAE